MSTTTGDPPGHRYNFYANQYAHFASEVAVKIRREVYGEDLGQQGWRSLEEQAAIAELVAELSPCYVLDIGCGSGGPSLALVEQTGCRLKGIDIETAGIAQAERQAEARGLTDRVSFAAVDCSSRLPFADGSFDLVICVDAVLHLHDRFAALVDWARLLRVGGRLVFTDAAVLTGAVSMEELDVRASQGSFLLAPPGLNEKAVEAAHLLLLHCEDRTQATAHLASRWHATRERYADDLLKQESVEWFAQRQSFLAMTADLAVSRRLSRFFYVAVKTTTRSA